MSLSELFKGASKQEVRIWLNSMEYRLKITAEALIGFKPKKIIKKLKR